MSNTAHVDDCHIHRVRQPDGRARYWCLAHNASATARFGSRLPRCEGAYRTVADFRRFTLDPDMFEGGVALWGAVEPVYNTASEPAERGIHVHARQKVGGHKAIDHTYDAIQLRVRRDLYSEQEVLITAETAVAYYISRFLEQQIVGLFCSHCNAPHLDSDWFAVKPHRTHLCHSCGMMFRESNKRVSNPLAMAQHRLSAKPTSKPVRAKGALDIRQVDYPYGLQIWASNPAILWTSSRPEQEGIHVHGWLKQTADPKLDGTFDTVRIDGIELNEASLRVFMAQNALSYMKGKVVSLACPQCGDVLFDQGEAAFRPTIAHVCKSCGARFDSPGRRRLASNPFVNTIKALTAASKGGIRA